MTTLRYIYDPKKQILMVYAGEKNLGGYLGQIAERKFEKLLCTDARIELGSFLSAKEKANQF